MTKNLKFKAPHSLFLGWEGSRLKYRAERLLNEQLAISMFMLFRYFVCLREACLHVILVLDLFRLLYIHLSR